MEKWEKNGPFIKKKFLDGELVTSKVIYSMDAIVEQWVEWKNWDKAKFVKQYTCDFYLNYN